MTMPEPIRPAGPTVLPLAEFDPDEALFAPRPPRRSEEFQPAAVLCFFPEILHGLERDGRARRVGSFSRENGGGAVLAVSTAHGEVTAFNPGVGAPLAALHLEQAVAAGVRDVVACGGAGAVRPGLALGHVVVPTGAVRDEGTSHHYLPAGRVVDTDAEVAAHLVAVLERHDVPHSTGLTWTTDGVYRETPIRIARRREEGCLTVEMETAALAAVCAYRGARFGQLLYAADDVSGPVWDHRRWTRAEVRAALFDLAAEAVTTLPPNLSSPLPPPPPSEPVRRAADGTAGASRRAR
jgi:uridine phosphorylase